MAGRPSTVVADTNVFSADLLRTTRSLVDLYRPGLEGRRFLISFQTLAELECGFPRRDWEPTRLGQARDHVRRAEVVWPGPALLATCVELRVACEREGHALAPPEHDADRWIAATGIHLSVPLVSHDGIFRGAPRLDFETALGA